MGIRELAENEAVSQYFLTNVHGICAMSAFRPNGRLRTIPQASVQSMYHKTEEYSRIIPNTVYFFTFP